MEFDMVQRLRQAVSYHLAGRDVGELDPLSRNFVTDIMMLDINVFGLGVEHWIMC